MLFRNLSPGRAGMTQTEQPSQGILGSEYPLITHPYLLGNLFPHNVQVFTHDLGVNMIGTHQSFNKIQCLL
jgi:hypothetical protein